MKIVIVGAGIGGLTLAAALREHDITIIEKRPRTEGIGAGIMLHDGALSALRSVGVVIKGKRFSSLRLGLPDGRELRSIPKSGDAVTRSSLHLSLLKAASHSKILTNTTVSHFNESANGVHVTLSNGDTLDADILVGSDGLGSDIRNMLGTKAQRRYSGETCWRGLTELDSGQSNPIEIWGKGCRVGIVPLLNGTYIYLTRTMGSSLEKTNAPIDDFAQFSFGTKELIQSVPKDAWFQHDLDELDSHAWGTRRVPLLGDAAHGFTPNLGEGAAQAILDATYLATGLAKHTESDWYYPGARKRQNTRIATMSRWVGRIAQVDGVWADTRDSAFKLMAKITS